MFDHHDVQVAVARNDVGKLVRLVQERGGIGKDAIKALQMIREDHNNVKALEAGRQLRQLNLSGHHLNWPEFD